MKKKHIICLGALCGFCILIYILLLKQSCEKNVQHSDLCIKGAYFKPVKITDYIAQIPCIEIEIGKNKTIAKIDLGFSCDLAVPDELLNDYNDKLFIQRDFSYGIRGKKYDADIFAIQKMKMGELILTNIKVKKIDPEFENDAILMKNDASPLRDRFGRVGWTLFHNFNFFMDCNNSMIALCDGLETLRQQGYPVDSFIEVPLLLDRNLIEFEAMTQTGPLRCLLDTGSTWNLLNKDIEGGSNDHMIVNPDNIDQHAILNPANTDQMIFDPKDVCEMPAFKIGNTDFGTITFNKFKTSLEIEAIIGMEFLESKLVFIDFPNRKIYFAETDMTIKPKQQVEPLD